MDVQTLTAYFHQYGIVVIFIIVFLEYLNLPGFPAGIVMPLAGIWAQQGNIGFGTTFLLSVLAGLCGSWILYFLGRLSGDFLLKKYIHKFPKHKPVIDKAMKYLENKGYMGIFLGKLIPMIRTLISIPAGVLKMNFMGYTLFSALGIGVWNFLFIGAGYLLGDAAFHLFS